MRVALAGVAHWHTPFYIEPLLSIPDVRVVAVADPSTDQVRRVAAQAHCPAFTSVEELCDATRPELVFALGRHCDMAATARILIARRVPFAIEKPCGLTAAEVAELAEQARAAGVFATVPFVFRYGDMLRAIQDTGETVRYASFKLVAGDVQRYRETRNDWMLTRETAGGGCTLNLGVHFLDLARVLFEEVAVAAATMSNAVAGLDVEDHGIVTLRAAGGGACLVETGYFYPAPTSTFDLHFSIRTERHHFAARDGQTLEVLDAATGRRELRPMPTTNVPYYPAFTRDVVRRVAAGQSPPAGLDDMLAAFRLVEAAYRLSNVAGAQSPHA
jgi:predicted dehydrogenase